MEREERRFIKEGKPQQRSSLPGIRQSGRAPCPQFGQMAARTETSTGKRAIFEPCAWTEPASREAEFQRKGAKKQRRREVQRGTCFASAREAAVARPLRRGAS